MKGRQGDKEIETGRQIASCTLQTVTCNLQPATCDLQPAITRLESPPSVLARALWSLGVSGCRAAVRRWLQKLDRRPLPAVYRTEPHWSYTARLRVARV